MKKIISFLYSEACVFIAIVCVMLAQIVHTTFVGYEKSHIDNSVLRLIFALFYASAIEFAILMYVINGQRTHAKVYAVGSFATNIFYYYAADSMYAPALMSLLLAGSIWGFSDLFVSKLRVTPEVTNLPFECDECGKGFASSRELNGHASAHKRMKAKEESVYTMPS